MARHLFENIRWHQLIAAWALSFAIATQGSAQVIRNFNTVPVEDSLIAADGTVDAAFVGTGGKLGTVTPPGGGNSSFNNTASTGYGMDANTYGGAYRIWGANLQAGLGTTSLTNFTIAYAYKPDNPNHPTDNKATRQLRMFDSFAGNTSLTIPYTGRRQSVSLSQFNPADSSTITYDFGTPSAGLSQRLMDGDTTTIPFPSSGTYDPIHATEWVFFAMTYEATDATHARVTEYGQVAGTALTQFYQSAIVDMSGNFHGSTFDISRQALDIGNVFSIPTTRPYDGYFDNFGFYSSALSLTQLAALGNAVFTPHNPVDYNGNGSVDAADYALWRKSPNAFGGSVGYADWAAAFGQTSPGAGLSFGEVPEPAALTTFLIGGTLMLTQRRRRVA